MRKTIIALVAMFAFVGCGSTDVNGDPMYDDSEYIAPSDPGGPGMTYNGKMGYDMGGGFVLPYDGSGIQPGFGM